MPSCCKDKEKKCRALVTTKPTPEKSIDKLSTIVSCAPSTDFSLGEKLQSVYPLLDLVFVYLSYKDLLSARGVCKIWRETALKYLKAGQEVAWFSVTGRDGLYELKRSSNLLLCNTHFSIVVTNPRMVALTSNICVKYLDYHSCCKVSDYLQKHIVGHPFRETVVLASTSITSHLDVAQKADRLTVDRSAINGLTIPEIPKTRIVFIQPHGIDDRSLRDQYVRSSETVNSLLIFCAHNERSNIVYFLNNLLDGQEPQKVAVAGGIITGSKKHFIGSRMVTGSQNSCDIHCIAFLQPRNEESNLLSYSLVVRDGTLEGFEKELLRFKEQITLRSQSAAFRFSCSCKEISRQDETFAFNTFFPNTSVLGMDVFGEIGWDKIDKSEGIARNKRMKTSEVPHVLHEWSTTFLLITWDK